MSKTKKLVVSKSVKIVVDYRESLRGLIEDFRAGVNKGNASIGGILRCSVAYNFPVDVETIPDADKGRKTREIELDAPEDSRDRTLRDTLQRLYSSSLQLADVRTTLQFLKKHGRMVYNEPYPKINTLFLSGDTIYRIKYGMVADFMNMRMEGPLFEVYPVYSLRNERPESGDVFLVVPAQVETQIPLPATRAVEHKDGVNLSRATIGVFYGNNPHNLVRILDGFCRTHKLGLRHAMSGPGNPNEVSRPEKFGDVRREVAEFWFDDGENETKNDLTLVCWFDVKLSEDETWHLAAPYTLLAYIDAYPETIKTQVMCTFYDAGEERMGMMCVGKIDGSPQPLVYMREFKDKEICHILPSGLHFLAVKKL